MTSPSKNLQFLVLILFAILFLGHCSPLTTNSNDAPSPLLKQVCSHTKTLDFCIASLNSDAKVDTKGLSHISLEISLSSAKENNAFISAMLKTTKDPGVKRGLKHCTVNYGGSLYALQ
ncbi:Pectinesterase inhibitor [Morus notabilis]|uniref:Pectinesterase inhibitor n=1 Tax=Morus notabilis TaxID=981085 RepID=W9QR51_9ROSA|nr:Pectinesterase inhibitor [Morus notabilis]